VYGAVIMAQLLQEFTQFRWQMYLEQPLTLQTSRPAWTTDLPLSSYSIAFTIAIYYCSAESCYLFHRPTQGRELSQPGWLTTYRDQGWKKSW